MIDFYHLSDDIDYGLYDLDKYQLEWVVTHAESMGYGHTKGEAIAKEGNILHLFILDCCSCYGPYEGLVDSFTVEEFLSGNIHKGSSIGEVNEKVRELLS